MTIKVLTVHNRLNVKGRRPHVDIRFREKSAKYGVDIKMELLRRSARVVILSGPHASGKSRYLRKIADNAALFWGEMQSPYSKKTKPEARSNPERDVSDKARRSPEWDWTPPPPVFIQAQKPVSEWVAFPEIKDWYGVYVERNNLEAALPWSRLSVSAKQDLLPEYLGESKAILFVDDADKLTGQKKETIKLCFRRAFRSVVAVKNENKLDPTIYHELFRTDPQILNLDSDVAYDATGLFIIFLMLLCVASGAYGLAAGIFVLRYFTAGKGGLGNALAKQN